MKSHSAAALLLLVVTAAAHGVPVSGSQLLDFQAGKQSLFGPGGVAASFRTSGSTGNSTLGFAYELEASTGTVEAASFDGFLNYSYEDGAPVGAADLVSFSFAGSPGAGLFETLYGASIDTEWRILGLHGCIYCKDASLEVERHFTPALDTPFSGSDTVTPATADVGPNVPGASATAGVDINLSQTSTLEVEGIHGQVTAVHQGSGENRSFSLELADNGLFSIDLGLDLAGVWDVSLTGLTLDNRFFSSFGASLTPFVQYVIGFGCGNPATDSDNFFTCGGDGRADWNLPGLSLGTTQTFALDFGSLNLSPFSITVVDEVAAAVPEPGSLALLGSGVLALGLLRRRGARCRL